MGSHVVGIGRAEGRISRRADYRAERRRRRALPRDPLRAAAAGAVRPLAGKVRGAARQDTRAQQRTEVGRGRDKRRAFKRRGGVRSSAKNVLLRSAAACVRYTSSGDGIRRTPHLTPNLVDANTGALTYLDFGMTVTVDAWRRSAMLRGLVGSSTATRVRSCATLSKSSFCRRRGDQRQRRRWTEVFDGGRRETNTKAAPRDERFPRCRVPARLGAVRVRVRLPPYFATSRARRAGSGSRPGSIPEFRVIGAAYLYVLLWTPTPRPARRSGGSSSPPTASPCGGAASRASSRAVAESLKNVNETIPPETLPGTEGDDEQKGKTRYMFHTLGKKRFWWCVPAAGLARLSRVLTSQTEPRRAASVRRREIRNGNRNAKANAKASGARARRPPAARTRWSTCPPRREPGCAPAAVPGRTRTPRRCVLEDETVPDSTGNGRFRKRPAARVGTRRTRRTRRGRGTRRWRLRAARARTAGRRAPGRPGGGGGRRARAPAEMSLASRRWRSA